MSAWRSSLSSQRLQLSIGKKLTITLAITLVCAVAACSCPIGKASSPLRLASEAGSDQSDTGSVGSVRPAKRTLQPDAADPQLFERPKPPSCEITGATKPPTESGHPGANADPNLLEIARLQLVNECYQRAERAVRERLESLQSAILKSAILKYGALDPELLKKEKPPPCELNASNSPSANADPNLLPNLLEITRLQHLNECYKLAEHAVRQRLERLQNAFADRLRS
jgi:hypothetical protein